MQCFTTGLLPRMSRETQFPITVGSDGRHGVWNHRQLDCFAPVSRNNKTKTKTKTKKNPPKLRMISLFGRFPSQMASNAENVSILCSSWRKSELNQAIQNNRIWPCPAAILHVRNQTNFPRYQGPLLVTWFNLIPQWMYNYIRYKVWDRITYPFPNFNGTTVEV